MERPVRISSVTPREDFIVELEFNDGTKREVDLEPFLRGKVFDSIRNDESAFRAVKVDKKSGTICWENGADIDPDVLYFGLTPAWAESEMSLPK
jgi:hypothetical protein